MLLVKKERKMQAKLKVMKNTFELVYVVIIQKLDKWTKIRKPM